MGLRFTVLASGSGGNASLVQTDGFGVLIDAGLGPRLLGSRLKAAGLSWDAVRAVLLTHTHSDHWKDATLALLARRAVPFYCHPDHHTVLRTYSDAFLAMGAAGLVRSFAGGEHFDLVPGLRCRPLPVRHDGGATFGFRLEARSDLRHKPEAPARGFALGYVADLGCWDEDLAAGLAGVDLLAVEFNHDVGMQYASGRMPRLIERVLGDEGHLSNEQAAGLVRAVLERSPAGRVQHLVQLHLSRDCNRPALARAAAQAVCDGLETPIEIHTARQDAAGATLHLGAAHKPGAPATGSLGTPTRRRTPRRTAAAEPWLPGFEEEAAGP
jgi:phosphoribosyl 1,2-cyclic phosphodiesterase